MKNICPKNKGLFMALLTAIISGVSIYVNKFAVGSITPPLLFTSVKNMIVGFMILIFVLISHKNSQITAITKQDKKRLLLIGVIGGALPFYLFFTGLSMIPAVNAAFIHKTLVIWVAMLSYPLLKEKLNIWQMLAVIALFASNLFVGGFSGLEFSLGELLVLIATLLWSIENVIAKKVLKNVAPEMVMLSRMGIGSLLLIIASLIAIPQALSSVTSISPAEFLMLGATSLTLFFYVFTWYTALKLEKATTVSAVLTISPLITNILTLVFTQGKVESLSVIQAGIIVLSLILFLASRAEETVEENNQLVYIESD